MADWDADGSRLSANLVRILAGIAAEPRRRPSRETARRWHRQMMDGLDVPQTRYVGRYRGEARLEGVEVQIGAHLGVTSANVADALAEFERRLLAAADYLDARIPKGANLSADELRAVIDLCAWAHAEWIRIQPFANGNGRTARLWADFIALRYGLPPFVRTRPRPGGDYGAAAAAAMNGNWRPTVAVFTRMYLEWIARA